MKKVVIILFQTPTSFFSHRYRKKKYSNMYIQISFMRENGRKETASNEHFGWKFFF